MESRVRAWNSKKRFSLAAGPSPDVDRKTSSLRRIAAAGGKKGSGEQSKSAPRPSCPTAAAAQQQELFQPHCQV